MKELIEKILNRLNTPGIVFADVRYTSSDDETFYFETGGLKDYSIQPEQSTLGIRVLKDGCWGFAGLNTFDDSAIDRAVSTAISNAEHGARFLRKKVSFPALAPTRAAVIRTPGRDPFRMDRDEKMAFFQDLAIKLHGKDRKDIVFDILFARFHRQYRVYGNTEGTLAESTSWNTLPLYQVIASNAQGMQTRTYPGHMSAGAGGWEIIEAAALEQNIETCVREARELLSAPRVSEEKADIIIGRGHLALQLHESVGHATEADRILGMEISYAGKTFIRPEMLGTFRYGSPQVTIYSDSSDRRGIGYHPVDDEGVPGKRVDIISQGILMDQQTDRYIAQELGLSPSSNMKSSHGYDYPLVRMTNFCLEPGNAGTLADLIKNTEKGYYLDHTKTWSIDDNRYNFQFTTEIGWKIENGEITGIVKEPTYYGITPEFWGACDAVCSPEEWRYHGTFDCGKGQPGQALHLSHGVAPARFRGVRMDAKA